MRLDSDLANPYGKEIAQLESWVSHHRKCVEECRKREHALEAKLKEAEEANIAINKQLDITEKKLERAEKVISFYADKKSWKVRVSSQAHDEKTVIERDEDLTDEPLWINWREAYVHTYFGGKRAREYFANKEGV